MNIAINPDIINKLSRDSFLQRVKGITLTDIEKGLCSFDSLFRDTVEELGELATAVSVETGYKNKKLDESSEEEAVDVVICALALFYARGGTTERLVNYGNKKLDKWQNNV